MNTPAANRHRVDMIHAEHGTTRNNAGGGIRKPRRPRPPVEPSGRRAQPRSRQVGVEGGRRIA